MEKEKVIDALVTCYKLTMERRTGREVKIIVERKDRDVIQRSRIYGVHGRRHGD